MKRLTLSFSIFVVVGLSASVAYGLKCGPFPAKGTCSTKSVDTMLQNTNDATFWKNPACLELVIAKVELTGENTPEDTKEKIRRGLAVGKEFAKEEKDSKKFWAWADRRNYVFYKLGSINATSGSSCRVDNGDCLSYEDEPGCFIETNKGKYPLFTGEQIVKTVECSEDSKSPFWYCSEMDASKREVGRMQAIRQLSHSKICLMKLNTLKNKQWANSGESSAYYGLLVDLTTKEMSDYADKYFEEDGRAYGQCVVAGERSKIESLLTKLDVQTDKDQTTPGGSVGGGQGGGGGGQGRGNSKPKSTGHKISHFKINVK